ncbi:MAG: TetR/AcrR family transcriptional regulator [Thiothrix sp.]|nr:TetR/AcrR family transcriptional regulator [Thiothrix sp.]HPQ93963.1 TetR/AcrR family transcriptional regulator [Thiolinea sp.]
MSEVTRRPYHHGDLHRVLIETALELLQEQGSWQFNLREVARRAGVSHAAPYRHFSDKAALLTELALSGFEHLGTALSAAMVRENPVRQQFLAAAQAYVAFAEANPALYRLMFSADAGTRADVHLSQRAMDAFGVVLTLLERGQQEGTFKLRPLQGQATACWAEVHGLALLAIDGLLLPEKVGNKPVPAALDILLEGLEA